MRAWTGMMIGTMALGLVLAAPGCKDNGVAVESGTLRATAEQSGLLLINDTGTRVHRFVVGESLIPLIDWIPACNDANAIETGREQRIGYQDILGYAHGSNVFVYWWHAVPGEGGALRADSLRILVVATP